MICFFFSRLWHDNRGFGAMELGLASPFLFLLSLGMIDASMLIGTKIEYEQAAQRTTDFALAKRPNSSDGTYLRNEAATASGVDAQYITVEIYRTCNGTRQGTFDGACNSGESLARYVNVSISQPVMTEFDWSAMAQVLGINAFGRAVTVSGDSLVRIQ
ncbi:TadE/TadG family type IV pilus assembly protein [Parerythrobacter aestuarii]|uniref:TadE/TadG family type IV pilus assembly protein n=1 Tax=Parerythrobacter aestuarii TaxID=3020909 RepID=UPI0024DEBAC2|nr:TadE/TadG family type IV pilus assembly protein [Parerythrobacter aestuarii]